MNIQNEKTIYGPVKSWRFGQSLGVDVLFQTSICSFNCIYCQLGDIQQKTSERAVYVSTDRVISEFKEFLETNVDFDAITFSGSGEPTLAKNIGEIGKKMKELCPDKPLQVLTNATMLGNKSVQKDLEYFDRVIVKLDAPNQKILKQINRVVDDIDFDQVLAGIREFRKVHKGIFDIQMMFTPLNIQYKDDYIDLLNELKPDNVQLNTPLRPYPLDWYRENRGNHTPDREYETRVLSTISEEQAKELEQLFIEKTGLKFISVYR